MRVLPATISSSCCFTSSFRGFYLIRITFSSHFTHTYFCGSAHSQTDRRRCFEAGLSAVHCVRPPKGPERGAEAVTEAGPLRPDGTQKAPFPPLFISEITCW